MIPIMSSKRKSKTITTMTKKPPLKKKELSPESTPNPSLPDDVLITCLARVSKLYYPTLSLVSKSFRSLLASPELYKARSLLRRTESCLYVCLHFPPEANARWYTLCRKPDLTLVHKKKSSSGNILVPIPSSQSTPPNWTGHAVVGSNIYHIGGYKENLRSSSVSILDCRSYTWREAPSLKVERMWYPSASVVDGKIYVAGGCQDEVSKSSKSMEVFDTKTQIWDYVPIPYLDQYTGWQTKSTCIEGKLYLMIEGKVLAYDPEEGRWDLVEQEMGTNKWFSNCLIENVLYCFYSGVLEWYDNKVRLWKPIKGLTGLPHGFATVRFVKLASYGGKMAVFWDTTCEPRSGKKMVWCAVIALERLNVEEIWGLVEWCDPVLIVPKLTHIENALAVTV
ncbi:Kelch repeat type 1 [Arabidopsis thaliana x Arabidopsis arenosa]|uniref:Kelch repeat type 1 n=1 Tax=Arabidopsis thaliana x Arabidopsis arenosa TaxID=1240361 RepID=A0A8T2C923_9BRAS|nr:Kelch repeat type 1 [Arabidopsis thaliana x Arabidopsis arenosa]